MEFPKREGEIKMNRKIEERNIGCVVQFVGKLSEAFKVMNLKRLNEEMED